MTQFTADPKDTETSSHYVLDRVTELDSQCWSRDKSMALASTEGIVLNDEHWAVIVFLRRHYMKHGLPITARTTAHALNAKFAVHGGSKYLHRLFSGGPVTQGSRLANVRTPAYASDPSFGTTY